MALLKNITQDTGVVLTYWRIMSIGFNRDSGSTNCTISGYIDAAAAAAGRKSAKSYNYNWSGVLTKDDLVNGDAVTKCYDKIKNLGGTTSVRTVDGKSVSVTLAGPFDGAIDG